MHGWKYFSLCMTEFQGVRSLFSGVLNVQEAPDKEKALSSDINAGRCGGGMVEAESWWSVGAPLEGPALVALCLCLML